MVNLEVMRKILDQPVDIRGYVYIMGEGVKRKDEFGRLGAGITTLLVAIPEEGVNISELEKSETGMGCRRPSSITGLIQVEWLVNELLPRNLVRETEPGSGIYVLTEAAKKADYNVSYLASSNKQ